MSIPCKGDHRSSCRRVSVAQHELGVLAAARSSQSLARSAARLLPVTGLAILRSCATSRSSDTRVIISAYQTGKSARITRMLCWSDGDGKVIEGDPEPVAGGDAGGDVVVAAAQVLREGVTGGEGASWAVTLQPAHRPEPGLQPPVVCLDPVVRILPRGVQGPMGSARRRPAGNRARGRW